MQPTRMTRRLFIALLVVQAHFAASYLVPLDDHAQRTFAGLLRWAWPWAIGDDGPLGVMTATGFPVSGFFLAVTAAGLLILAALSVAGIRVPFSWWKPLAVVAAALSIVLMMLFFGLTKLLPTATGAAIAAAGLGYWSPVVNPQSTVDRFVIDPGPFRDGGDGDS